MKSIQFMLTIAALSIATTFYGQEVPDATVSTLDGQKVSFSDVVDNEKITIVSFWATWCAPCKRELDALMDLYPEWEDAGYEVEVIAVSIDDARFLPRVKPMVVSKGWDEDFKILTDANQDLQRALNFQNVPYSFVFKGGKIVYSHDGYTPGDEDEVDELVEKLSNSK